MRLLDQIPPPPATPGVFEINPQTVRLPGLPPMRISGWLAPASANTTAGGTIQWFHNGVHIADEGGVPALLPLYGAIAVSDEGSLFRRSRAIYLLSGSVQSAIREWLGNWILQRLGTAHEAGPFLKGCLDGPGLAQAVEADPAWAELTYRSCPIPTTHGDMTLEEFHQTQSDTTTLRAVSVWPLDFALAYRTMPDERERLYESAESPRQPPRDPPPPVLTGDLTNLYVRQVIEAVTRDRDITILYVDQRHYIRSPFPRTTPADCERLEDIFLEAFQECGWPSVNVEVSVAPGFDEDARIYRSARKFRENWLESALLRLRADGPICTLLKGVKPATLLRSRTPLTVFFQAHQWCFGPLGDPESPFRRQFWETAYATLRESTNRGRSLSGNEADRIRARMEKEAEDLYYRGRPMRRT